VDVEVSECLADSHVEVEFFEVCFGLFVEFVADLEVFVFEGVEWGVYVVLCEGFVELFEGWLVECVAVSDHD